MSEKIITLLTDFGEDDWFVGSMKGVLAGVCPRARLIDITHLIPSGDIRKGAFILKCSYRYFPKGTVHLAVVDPGVGSDRGILVVRGAGYTFVAPDNGLLSYIIDDIKEKALYHADRKNLFLFKVSNTFHGRDVFAPLAARLANGFPIEEIGTICREPIILPRPVCRTIGNKIWEIEIITIDKFGNCIMSLPLEKLQETSVIGGLKEFEITLTNDKNKKKKIISAPLAGSYSSINEGSLLISRGSCGLLELAVNRGDAAAKLGLATGDKLILRQLF